MEVERSGREALERFEWEKLEEEGSVVQWWSPHQLDSPEDYQELRLLLDWLHPLSQPPPSPPPYYPAVRGEGPHSERSPLVQQLVEH